MSEADELPVWPRRPGRTLRWLMAEGRRAPDVARLLRGLVGHLAEDGLPLGRATVHIRTLHPLFLGVRYLWQRDVDTIDVAKAEHGVLETPTYLNSPMRLLFDGEAGGVRQRLDLDDDVPLPFPFYEELRAQGLTDYVALPLTFASGRRHAVTFAADRPGGFTTEDLIRIDDLIPVLEPLLEVHAVRKVAVNILDTYVGRRAGQRVLDGYIKRGDGETIRAAIWFSDLRGFTQLSARHDRDTLIAMLNDHFETMAEPVARHGGETLKFIGDAMLAMFPLTHKGACDAALSAARDAMAGMARLNERRRAAGEEALGYGIVLHAGDVMYGNIGAPDRLDFTVIGPAVNVAERVQELCKSLGETVLATSEFAALAPLAYRRLGRYPLRGVEAPVTVYVPLAVETDGG